MTIRCREPVVLSLGGGPAQDDDASRPDVLMMMHASATARHLAITLALATGLVVGCSDDDGDDAPPDTSTAGDADDATDGDDATDVLPDADIDLGDPVTVRGCDTQTIVASSNLDAADLS